MSESPDSRSVSPLWFLALIPVALGAVWLIGRLPEPAAKSSVETIGTQTDVGAPETRGAVQPVDATFGMGSPSTEPAPAESEPREIQSAWTTPEQAMSQSQGNGKAILLEFTAEWSPEGTQLRSEVFSSSILGRSVQLAVIPVAVIDREREDGENSPAVAALKEQFKVSSIPTLVVFSPHTGRVVSSKGFHGADETVRWIRQAAAEVR